MPSLIGLPPALWHSLLILLFATSYDTRTTMADPTPESAWTIISLTPLFTSLLPSDSYATVSSALKASFRRALSFPLYRHWELCQTVQKDVAGLLQKGRQTVLRSLLGLKKVLDETVDYAVLNKVWVNAFIVLLHRSLPRFGSSPTPLFLSCLTWLIALGFSSNVDMTLGFIAGQVERTSVDKKDLGWPLQDLELETKEGEVEPLD